MFRALLGGILRFLLWFFAFYLIAHVVRGIARAIFGSNRKDQVDGRVGTGAVEGRPTDRKETYKDVQDASFQDLPRKDAEPPQS